MPDGWRHEKVEFAIEAAGQGFGDGGPLTRGQTAERFAAAGRQALKPEIHLRADQAVADRAVAETLADATRAGLTRIGFVSDPETR